MQLTTYFCPKLSNNSNNYYWFEKKVFVGKTEDNSRAECWKDLTMRLLI